MQNIFDLMASSSGTSSTTTKFPSSGSEKDLQLLMDQRKRKRMESNRESAKRSRMRKQKQLNDRMAQVAELTQENSQILSDINATTQHYLNVERENTILRAQIVELSQRLQSLNDILNCINTSAGVHETDSFLTSADNLLNPMTILYLNQPIMASPDFFQW
ncbi:hypothetical protein L6164_015328 [Bauhinia variegata]|uniref:Uncharacterized protein n=1 Tax=Bauhinia variegata TaxID=167791 RepID=A0ACB9NKA4_BAUVA|nr:hypothetical protein L6164_015328 [Bauhinia variegata]